MLAQSLSMDLLRVALGLHRGSSTMAKRFKKEALKLCLELEKTQDDKYILKLAKNSKVALNRNDKNAAEEALMYSILLQNYALKKL